MSDAEPSKSPALRLEQVAAGERVDAADAAELAALRASNAEILAAHPPAAVAAEVRRRAALQAARRRSRRAVWLGLPVVATAAIVIVALRPWAADGVVAVPEPSVLGDMGSGDTRIKGLGPHLVLHRQVGAEAEVLRAPARAVAGDVLQVSYVAAGAAHGVIVSIDGGGVVTLHHPASAAGETALQQGGAVRLGQAYELDAAPGFERFVLVTASAPIDPAKVVAAAEALAGRPDAPAGPLALPAGWVQSSFLVEKVSP